MSADTAPATVRFAVSCASCGTSVLTPPCATYRETDDYLDALGWTSLYPYPHCPNCASYGGMA